jgi:hypothetical protein
LLRKTLPFETELPPGVIFKIADQASELEQLPLSKWHCLPSTTTLICKSGGRVLASVTLIADSGFGLPVDQKLNLGRFRQKGIRVLEIASLTPGEYFLPLLKFVHAFSSRVMRADALVISSGRELADELAALFLFEPLDQGKLLISGIPVGEEIPQVLFLHGMEAKFMHHRKLHQFVFETESAEYFLPQSKYRFSLGTVLSSDEFHYLFTERSKILESLTAREKFFLSEYYHFEEFKKILPTAEENVPYQRSSPRIAVRYRASIINKNSSRIRSGEVHQIALHGLALKITNMDFEVGERISVIIDMEDSTRMKIHGNIIWTGDHTAGVRLEALPEAWREFNEYAWAVLKNELRLSA